MPQVTNMVFLGCNYNDKKIKMQFDSLKKRIETDTALSCIVVDKRHGKPARDIWRDIKDYIERSSICIFDVTSFRPNVVLELGYALSIKAEDQLLITFRKRKSRGQAPKWLLSDISHLQRFDYINVRDLEKHLREQLSINSYEKSFQDYSKDCDTTNAGDRYREFGLKVLQQIRDDGPRTQQQIKAIISGSACRIKIMLQLLKRHHLIVRTRGNNGKYSTPEVMD